MEIGGWLGQRERQLLEPQSLCSEASHGPMGVVSPSLNLTQLIPALLAGEKQRSSTFPLEWLGTSWNLGPTKAWS